MKEKEINVSYIDAADLLKHAWKFELANEKTNTIFT